MFLSAVPNSVSTSVGIHHLASLLSKLSKQFQFPKHRFNLRQNTPLLAFYSFPKFLSRSTFIGPWQIQLPNHRFKLNQKAPFTVLDFKVVFALPIAKTPFQIQDVYR